MLCICYIIFFLLKQKNHLNEKDSLDVHVAGEKVSVKKEERHEKGSSRCVEKRTMANGKEEEDGMQDV